MNLTPRGTEGGLWLAVRRGTHTCPSCILPGLICPFNVCYYWCWFGWSRAGMKSGRQNSWGPGERPISICVMWQAVDCYRHVLFGKWVRGCCCHNTCSSRRREVYAYLASIEFLVDTVRGGGGWEGGGAEKPWSRRSVPPVSQLTGLHPTGAHWLLHRLIVVVQGLWSHTHHPRSINCHCHH